MPEHFTPLLTTTDWNGEWKALQAARQHADDPAVWDERAKTFPVKHGDQSGYVNRFLELADIRPGDTVLDMGCGTGALATPLAQRGCRVIACDFSHGMLEKMLEDQAALGIGADAVDARLLSWSDDWEGAGLGRGCADVALASRSVATADLKASLLKLSAAAKRRACITLPLGPTPRIDGRVLEAAGLRRQLGQDFLYAFNILATEGFHPQVDYIESSRFERFASFDDACAGFTKIARDAARAFASEGEIAAIPERIRAWLETELVNDEEGFHLREPRRVTWAFLAWTAG